MSSTVDAPSQALAPRSAAYGLTKPSMAVGTFQCLVIAQRGERREMLTRAAMEAGWTTVACADARNGRAASEREVFRLALVDLAGLEVAAASEVRGLCERLASTTGLLLVMCGNEGDPLEEIWARQLGVWLYLPGVNEQCDVQALCEQALPVADRVGTGLRSKAERAR